MDLIINVLKEIGRWQKYQIFANCQLQTANLRLAK